MFFRIYTGTLPKGMSLYNPRTRRSERVSRLVLMRAIEREEIEHDQAAGQPRFW